MGEAVLSGRRVLLLIVGHLANAPRARKEASALVRAGAKVYVRGVWTDPARVEEDHAIAREIGIDYARVCDLRPREGSRHDRFRQRVAALATRGGVYGPRMLGPGAPEALREARRLRCDLTIAHGEPGMWAASHLRADGLRVGVDFEDWFSHDQLDRDRPLQVRRTLRGLERGLLQQASHVSTTTGVMAEALARDAGTSRRPLVVPNSFDFGGAPDPAPPSSTMRFHWFSQTVGPGRGLDVLADALPHLHGDWSLTLRGALHGHARWYDEVFGARFGDRVQRCEPLPVDALPAAVAQHDVGLALEVPYCPNKDLTASNKLFDYLRCGLAVIATDTAGQVEAMSKGPVSGWTVPAGDAPALADVLQRCIDNRDEVVERRGNARIAARDVWDFKRFEPALIDSVVRALEGGT